MNDIGLFSAEYEILRAQAELLDEVLVGIKTNESRPEDEARQQLAALLEAMSQTRSDDIAAQTLTATLREEVHVPPQRFAAMAQTLRSVSVSPNIVRELGQIAEALEGHRAGTMARMRGWTR